MNDRFTQLETLRKASWDAITSRRKYEWRVSIAFWGLMGAFVAVLVTEKIDVLGCDGLWLLLFPIILGASHLRWVRGLFNAFTFDKKEEEALRRAMRKEASYDEPEEITSLRRSIAAARSSGVLRHWYHGPQIYATIAFTLLAMFVVCLKVFDKKSNHSREPTPMSVTSPAAQEPRHP